MGVVSGTVYDSSGAPAAGRKVRVYRRDTGVLLGEVLTGTGVVTPGDSAFSSVALLLHGNGSDGSTTISDSSPTIKTPSSVIGATISATVATAFDGTSIRLASASSRILYAHNAAFQPTGDFCVQVRFMLPSITGVERVLVWKGTGTGPYPYYIYVDGVGRLKAACYGTASANLVEILSAETISSNTWHQATLDRNGSTFRLFLDGVLVGSASNSGALYSSASDPLVIGNVSDGGYGAASGGAAYVEEVRITLQSRHTAAFTPSVSPYFDFAEIPAVPGGTYSIDTGAYTGEVQRIVLDDDAGTVYNDLIDRIMVTA